MADGVDADGANRADAADERDAVVAGRYRILPDSPLKDLDIESAPAFIARDARSAETLLMGRICDPALPPRVHAMAQLKSAHEPRLVAPIDWGPVYWPPAGEMRMAVILNRPTGRRMMADFETPIRPMSHEAVVKRVLTPIAYTLQRFDQRKICHNDIRPTNLFYAEGEIAEVTMGDCVAVPSGWTQPPAFQTIEAMMTPRVSRGEGTIDNDLYALGVTVLYLALGHCPSMDMSPEKLLDAKLQRGSFSALLNGEMPPAGLREPLRGLLEDHPENRWRLEDLILWITGVLRRTVKPVDHIKPDRPFTFMGADYITVRGLAHAFGAAWNEADNVVREQGFQHWLRRGVADYHLSEMVISLIDGTGADPEGGSGSSTDLVTRICNRLDPTGPIRFRGLVTNPDGIGQVLFDAIRRGDQPGIRRIVEYINGGALTDWFESKPLGGRADLEPQVKKLRRLQQFLRHSGPGFGIERCLYELSPHAPCLSTIFKGRYVSSLELVLPALEDVVESQGKLPHIVDRHIVAFIALHHRKSIGPLLSALEEGGGSALPAKLAMLSLFARVQLEAGPVSLPHLTAWLANELGGAVKRYKSRTTRDEIKKRLGKVAAGGNLGALYNVLNSERVLKRDDAACNAALREYTLLSREIEKLESAGFQEEAQRKGWQIAAFLSSAIAFSTVGSIAFW